LRTLYDEQFYWGTEEILIPVYQVMKECLERHSKATVLVNFASFRSVHTSVTEALQFSDQIKTIAIIAEGVPESQTRALNQSAKEKGVGIIGPATVGGIKVSTRRADVLFGWQFFVRLLLTVLLPSLTFLALSSLDVSALATLAECWTISLCPNYIVQGLWPMYPRVVVCPTNSTTSSAVAVMVCTRV
jgi:hypothetical protein